MAQKIPRPEHPRPDFERRSFFNLNGTWRFAFDDGNRGLREGWEQPGHVLDRDILVPFAYQSERSGIGHAWRTSRPCVGGAWMARACLDWGLRALKVVPSLTRAVSGGSGALPWLPSGGRRQASFLLCDGSVVPTIMKRTPDDRTTRRKSP